MKSLKIYLIAAACFMLSSCVAITYIGDKHDPSTTNVDVFYSAHDVKNQYKVLGHMACPNTTTDLVKQEMVKYAKKVGADAIIITGTQITKDATLINADAIVYEK